MMMIMIWAPSRVFRTRHSNREIEVTCAVNTAPRRYGHGSAENSETMGAGLVGHISSIITRALSVRNFIHCQLIVTGFQRNTVRLITT